MAIYWPLDIADLIVSKLKMFFFKSANGVNGDCS